MPPSGKHNDKSEQQRAIPAESRIIRYFSSDRYQPAPSPLPCTILIHCIYIKTGAFVTYLNDTFLFP
jgi:hypothetical protein